MIPDRSVPVPSEPARSGLLTRSVRRSLRQEPIMVSRLKGILVVAIVNAGVGHSSISGVGFSSRAAACVDLSLKVTMVGGRMD